MESQKKIVKIIGSFKDKKILNIKKLKKSFLLEADSRKSGLGLYLC